MVTFVGYVYVMQRLCDSDSAYES